MFKTVSAYLAEKNAVWGSMTSKSYLPRTAAKDARQPIAIELAAIELWHDPVKSSSAADSKETAR